MKRSRWLNLTHDIAQLAERGGLDADGTGLSNKAGRRGCILCVACGVIAVLALGVRAVVAQKSGARSGASQASFTAPADAKVAAMAVAMNDRSRWRWRMYLAIWLVGLALVWAVVLGWHGWDFHRRAADAGSDYKLLRLDRTTTVAHLDDGGHWALQGRLLWDRSATHTTKDRVRETETVYVPVAGADWRPGDAVQFVVRLPKSEVWALQHRADGADAPLLVRVDGALPTPSRAVFQRVEAPPVDAAVLVEVVDSSAGRSARPIRPSIGQMRSSSASPSRPPGPAVCGWARWPLG